MIVRTAAEGAGTEAIERDLRFLQRVWAGAERRAQTVPAPALVYAEAELAVRSVRDLLGPDFAAVIVDDEKLHRRLRSYLQAVAPELKDQVERYTTAARRCSSGSASSRRWRRPSRAAWACLPAGYIVIDHTEAMTVIDVNTGRYVGRRQLEDTTLKTNLEACQEIVRQLRLRDIGGHHRHRLHRHDGQDQPGGGPGRSGGGVRARPHQDLRGGDLAARAGGDDPPERHPGAAGDGDRSVPASAEGRAGSSPRSRRSSWWSAPGRPAPVLGAARGLRVEVHPRMVGPARAWKRRVAAASGGRDRAPARCVDAPVTKCLWLTWRWCPTDAAGRRGDRRPRCPGSAPHGVAACGNLAILPCSRPPSGGRRCRMRICEESGCSPSSRSAVSSTA